MRTNPHQITLREVLPRKRTSIRTSKAGLKCENERDTQLVKHRDSCSGLFALGHSVCTIGKIEVVKLL